MAHHGVKITRRARKKPEESEVSIDESQQNQHQPFANGTSRKDFASDRQQNQRRPFANGNSRKDFANDRQQNLANGTSRKDFANERQRNQRRPFANGNSRKDFVDDRQQNQRRPFANCNSRKDFVDDRQQNLANGTSRKDFANDRQQNQRRPFANGNSRKDFVDDRQQNQRRPFANCNSRKDFVDDRQQNLANGTSRKDFANDRQRNQRRPFANGNSRKNFANDRQQNLANDNSRKDFANDRQQNQRRPFANGTSRKDFANDRQQFRSSPSRRGDHAQPKQQPKMNSVVGVVLTFSVDFLVYHFEQRKSLIVKVPRSKFPDAPLLGAWFRLCFSDDFDLVGRLRSLVPDDGEDMQVLEPRRVVACQRRLSTRVQDEQVMFFVTAKFKHYCALEDAFLYKCAFGMLRVSRAQLDVNDAADEQEEQGQQQRAQADESPQLLKVWIWPSGAGDVNAEGYFHVKRINARIWITNEPDSDSDVSSVVNGGDPLALSTSFSAWFDETVTTFYKANRLSDQRRLSIERFVTGLQRDFRTETGNDTLKLELFGSVLSGFGSNRCDIDLCLTNTGIANNENERNNGVIPQEKRREFLNKLVQYLRKIGHYTVDSVTDARTPILKFEYHGEERLHGDISVENGLALHNTELLRLYSCFDERVPPLGFAVKRWAKLCDVNDASAGSISSYAYIVMLIHFLQRVQPPVLPFLQQKRKGQMVEGWSVSYDRQLPEPFSTKNTRSLAQLFSDFLLFYASQFDMRTDVAQIRTPLPYDKQIREQQNGYTNDKRFRLCVEDPFDLEHNLTSGVREDTLRYIIKCFRCAARGMARFDEEHFATKQDGGGGGDGVGKAQPSPTMSFDQLMQPFKPRRVVHLNNNNNNTNNNSIGVQQRVPKN